MSATKINLAWTYYDEKLDITFTLVDDKLHDYETLIIAEKHLVVTNKDLLIDPDVKGKIIKRWFLEENEAIKLRNKVKRKGKLRAYKNSVKNTSIGFGVKQ